jgi:ribosome-associated translation inhibitor RaiA
MKHNVEFKNLAPQPNVRRLIERLVQRTAKRAKIFAPDEAFLRLMIEENQARALHRVSLTLELPGKRPATKKTLAAKAERHDAVESLRDAFAEIERQLAAYKATLRGDPGWKRKARRDELRKITRGVSEAS